MGLIFLEPALHADDRYYAGGHRCQDTTRYPFRAGRQNNVGASACDIAKYLSLYIQETDRKYILAVK